MTRDIDISKELSEDEVQYLVDRNRFDLLKQNEEATSAKHDDVQEPEPGGISEQAQSASLGQQEAVSVPDGANPAPASLGQRQAQEGNIEATRETDERPYEDWGKQELKSQSSKRGLNTGGNKQELVDRLRSWDEDNPEEESEESSDESSDNEDDGQPDE